MPSVTFPFQSTFHRGNEWTSSTSGRTSTVTVQDDVTVEVRDVSNDPAVSFALAATDRTGEHRILRVRDDLYSAVVAGQTINGRGGRLSGKTFSRIVAPTHHILSVGSRVLVGSPSSSGLVPLDALDEYEASGHEVGKSRFVDRLRDVVTMDGILYLPTTAVPSLALRRDLDDEGVVMLVDPSTVTDGASTHRLHNDEMLIPWSLSSMANALDRTLDLRIFEAEILSIGDQSTEYYADALAAMAKSVLWTAGLSSMAGKSPSYLRDYADAVDTLRSEDRAAVWPILNGPLWASLSPNDKIRVSVAATIAILPDADAVLDPVDVHATTRDLNLAVADVVAGLDETPADLGDAMRDAVAPVPEDRIPVLRRLRDEAVVLMNSMRQDRLPDHASLTEAVVRADHCLSANARHEIDAARPVVDQPAPRATP